MRREAVALVSAGWEVDVFGLQREGQGPSARLGGVRLRRLPVRRHQGAGIATYVAEYLHFFALAALALARAHRERHYRVVQVHTLPDFLVFAAAPLRLAGVPLVLDLHEAMPEFFRSRFPHASSRLVERALEVQERASVAAATVAITVNDALARRLVRLGVRRGKVHVVLNSPDTFLFDASLYRVRPFLAEDRLRLVYTGALTPIYELDVVIRALAQISAERPALRAELHIYGRGDSEDSLRALAQGLGLAERVQFHGRIPLEAVPAVVAEADVALAPTRRDPFTELSLSTKVFEYAAMSKPVIASRLATLEHYFPDGTVATYAPGDPLDLARSILRLVSDPEERSSRVSRTTARAAQLSWTNEAERYVRLMEETARLAGR